MIKRFETRTGRLLSWMMTGGALLAVVLGSPVSARSAGAPVRDADDRVGIVAEGAVHMADLPSEAQRTLRRVEQGGPFPYARDGAAFGNYERRLPARRRGYYREYTVKTRGARHRGARRIVCGGGERMVNDCYYTEDHYNRFQRIQR